MKKLKNIILILLLFTTSSCTNNNKLEEQKKIELLNNSDIVKEIYIDDNNTILNFYNRSNNMYNIIPENYYLPFIAGKDITVLKVLATNKEKINGYYMQDIFPEYWKNNNNYKIGYNLSFYINDKEINCNILKPSDRLKELLDYVIVFLYDDINQIKGNWYSHLEDDSINENTLFTSIKLYANTKINEITSPIKLTVFSYNDQYDFDPITGLYRGNSFKEIYINKSN